MQVILNHYQNKDFKLLARTSLNTTINEELAKLFVSEEDQIAIYKLLELEQKTIRQRMDLLSKIKNKFMKDTELLTEQKALELLMSTKPELFI